MPIYKGVSEIASGNFYKGSTNIENGYKENNSFYVNTLTFALDFLVVGAGGTAVNYGGQNTSYPYGGAGGGGFRTSYGSASGGGTSSESSLSITTGIAYDVIVGSGNCKFHTIISIKGGNAIANPTSGGSGGGAYILSSTGGAGTAGQGYAGGNTVGNSRWSAAGGGGASAIGGAGAEYGYGGSGGAGLQATILSSSQASSAGIGEGNYFSGGGGGQSYYSDNGEHGGAFGIGGGGGLVSGSTYRFASSYPNSGGGGFTYNIDPSSGNTFYGYGADGVVVVRYPNTVTATLNSLTEASNSPITDGSDKITIIKAGTGTITFAAA